MLVGREDLSAAVKRFPRALLLIGQPSTLPDHSAPRELLRGGSSAG